MLTSTSAACGQRIDSQRTQQAASGQQVTGSSSQVAMAYGQVATAYGQQYVLSGEQPDKKRKNTEQISEVHLLS